MYERDGGVLWKHYDIYTKNNDVRRSKELVIFFVAAIGNYDYALAYVFRQDGTLAVECQLTGIMLPMGVAEKTVDGHHTTAAWGPYGHLVAPNVVAPHHQHFFNFRIDFDVDGTGNSALEHNTRQVEDGGDNPPWMNVFTMETTTLKSEKEAGRLMNLASSRKWSVVNPSKKTALGYNPGFYLIPGENSLPYLHPDSITRKRAGFIENHFWVTRYREGEVYAGGTYPNQGRSIGEGLPAWVKDNESLENQDLVAWYTFGVTHIPRPEEWPVMPTAHAGFKIIPSGFFTQNPAMDVPKY
jgi:primary-amine oxidase